MQKTCMIMHRDVGGLAPLGAGARARAGPTVPTPSTSPPLPLTARPVAPPSAERDVGRARAES